MELCWKHVYWKNSNIILICSGLPGVGKTTFAEYMMWSLDRTVLNKPRASLQNFTCTAQEFVKAVKRNRNMKGRVIIWEEPYAAGVKQGGANARQFMRKANMQISTIFGTMRKNNHIIILTLPFSQAFDFQARNVAHGTIYVLENNGQFSRARFYKREFNPVFNTVYNKNYTYTNKGEVKKLALVNCGMPPKEFHKACTQKSDYYKDLWADEIDLSMGAPEKDKRPRRDILREAVMLDLTTNPENFTKQKNTSQGIVDIWNFGKLANKHKTALRVMRDLVAEVGMVKA